MEALSLREYSILILVLALSGISSAEVVINEMLPHAASDWYENGEVGDMNDEFIELYNPGEGEADLSGYTLTDTSYRRSPGLYTFPEGTTIPAGGFLVVYSIESGVFQGDDRDAIRLNNSSGETVDEMGYECVPGGDISFARLPDGGEWNVSSIPTPGEANRQAALVRAVHLSFGRGRMEFGVDDLPDVEIGFKEASLYQKVAPGHHLLKVTDPEDESLLLELELDLAAETRTSLLLAGLSDPFAVEDAVGIPEVKTSWLRFANLASDPADLILPTGGTVWFGGNETEIVAGEGVKSRQIWDAPSKFEIVAGGSLFEGVEGREVTSYAATYSGDLEVEASGLKETLDLGDGGIYTLVLIADQETAEKELVLVEDRPSTEE